MTFCTVTFLGDDCAITGGSANEFKLDVQVKNHFAQLHIF